MSEHNAKQVPVYRFMYDPNEGAIVYILCKGSRKDFLVCCLPNEAGEDVAWEVNRDELYEVGSWDIRFWDEAVFIAKHSPPELGLIPIDRGQYVSPRYCTMRRPKVGDAVSYQIGSDRYPDGKITSISESLRVIRTSGSQQSYYRRGSSGRWIRQGTYVLLQGTHEYRDPHF